eukprot:TRINITY_DN11242_c0_g1_i1.p1 TRINITY_DN11242_c0_g1~~TRINITY_DN11242_c0_g1_i1.p1  ORF type:complete len:633 (-),score=57.05 TRINITY_DN11242_c0_g1_i1:47-1882(-)
MKLTLDHRIHRLTMLVRGPKSASQFGSLIESIDTLVSDWLTVKVNITVPCLSCYGSVITKPHQFSIQECEEGVTSGKSELKCPVCSQDIRLDLLVPDLTMGDAVGGMDTAHAISYSSLDVGKEIGRGGFAVVYKGYYKNSEVAIKQLTAGQSSGDTSESDHFSDYFAEFRREVWLMSKMKHKNVVQLEGVVTQPLCMVLEFCGGGDLYTYLHKRPVPSTPKGWATHESFALDIAQGCEYLHSTTPPIIHRDLKSPNILIKQEAGGLVCKLADFGLSRGLVWSENLEGKVVDNPIWLAPEILQHMKYSEKVDVYAFGVILWEIVSHGDFFGHVDFMTLIEDMVIKGQRPEIPETTPEYLQDLIEQSWADSPAMRPSFRQLTKRLIAKDATSQEAPDPMRFVDLDFFTEELEEMAKKQAEIEELQKIRLRSKAVLKKSYVSKRRRNAAPAALVRPIPTTIDARTRRQTSPNLSKPTKSFSISTPERALSGSAVSKRSRGSAYISRSPKTSPRITVSDSLPSSTSSISTSSKGSLEILSDSLPLLPPVAAQPPKRKPLPSAPSSNLSSRVSVSMIDSATATRASSLPATSVRRPSSKKAPKTTPTKPKSGSVFK